MLIILRHNPITRSQHVSVHRVLYRPFDLNCGLGPLLFVIYASKLFKIVEHLHLHNLRRIKKYLSRDSLITLVHAFITSRLDYCNGLLFGLPKAQIAKLQRVQNAAARLILGIGKFSHITPALYELYWLPVSLRILIIRFYFRLLNVFMA